jgi:hypothetical protein
MTCVFIGKPQSLSQLRWLSIACATNGRYPEANWAGRVTASGPVAAGVSAPLNMPMIVIFGDVRIALAPPERYFQPINHEFYHQDNSWRENWRRIPLHNVASHADHD